MQRWHPSWLIDHLESAQPVLWLIAVLFFGFGDVVTTSIGLGVDSVYEAGSLTSRFIHQYGQFSMVVVKSGLLAGCYFLWRIVPRPHRTGVPLGLALLGVAVVLWNLFVIALATHL